MKADDPLADNLFTRLASYTPRAGRTSLEDFCTESLAWCLRNSPGFRQKFLKRVQDSLIVSNQALLPADENPTTEVYTQLSFGGSDESDEEDDSGDSDPKKGRFDLAIRSVPSDKFALVVEVKVDSDFADTQLPRYREELARGKSFQTANRKFLVSLTKRRYEAGKMNLDATLVWSDVQQLLHEASVDIANTNTSADGIYATDYLLGQFARFLKSKGMHQMKIPKIRSHEAFGSGVEFCHAIQQLLLEVRNGSLDLRSVVGDKIDWSEDTEGGVWTALVKNDFWMSFKFSPSPRMLVEASSEEPFVLPTQAPENMSFEDWRPKKNGFGIYGEFWPDFDGNAEKIRDWFEQAARLAIKLRKGG